jgi:hypothetical protein
VGWLAKPKEDEAATRENRRGRGRSSGRRWEGSFRGLGSRRRSSQMASSVARRQARRGEGRGGERRERWIGDAAGREQQDRRRWLILGGLGRGGERLGASAGVVSQAVRQPPLQAWCGPASAQLYCNTIWLASDKRHTDSNSYWLLLVSIRAVILVHILPRLERAICTTHRLHVAVRCLWTLYTSPFRFVHCQCVSYKEVGSFVLPLLLHAVLCLL